MPIEKLEDPEGLRETAGGPVKKAVDRDELERCATEKANAELIRAGATLRAALYDPSTIASLAIGTVGLMLAQILNGTIEVRDAKQAAEVANIALKISAQVTDVDTSSTATPDTPAGRADLIAKKDDLIAEIRKRAADVAEKHGADTKAGNVDLDEFDLDDDDDARGARLSVVRSAS